MKRRYYILLVLFFLAVAADNSFANNIAVENVSLVDKDTGANTYDIQFDTAWDNSWFITGAPSATANWDAAWVFAKFSKSTDGGATWSDWAHCTLLNTGSSAPTGSQMSFGDTSGVYKGAFIYRSSAGSGSVDWNDAEIRWAYGTDSVGDTDTVKIKVFAIEMAYIPTANFYVGDGTNRTGGSNSHFFDAADLLDPRDPVLVTSTQPYISNVSNGLGTAGDITWVNESTYAGNLPASRAQLGASYPTGYNAFYIMKYEISQGQYRDFLNTLTRTQQNNRTASQTASQYVMSNSASVSYRSGIRAPASIPSGAITFGCDLDADATFNESDDGEWIACNYLSWMDVVAYADWAALRPFTELEFEKACRGGQTVVNNEYAWGDATVESATTSLANGGTTSEAPNQGNLNYSSSSPDGPYRVGSFADASSTRANSGAGYYGIMELSGNLWERPVSVMSSQTGTTVSAFDGSNGDGSLSSTGFATNSNWPGADAQGGGFRGGNWSHGATYARVSDRSVAASAYTNRIGNYGGRCARTSP